MDMRIIYGTAAGFIAGGVVGYFVAREIEGRKAEHYINSEIQSGIDYWKNHQKMVEYAEKDVEATVAMMDELTKPKGDKEGLGKDWIAERIAHRDEVLTQMEDQTEEYDTTDDNEPEEVITVEEKEQNIFEKAAEEPDPTVPRLISIDEFMEDAQDFDKITVIFFEGDGTMVDSGDQRPIDDIQRLVGDEFTSNWGKNSRDPNIVYVRNLALEVDFEITRDPRTFEDWILGPAPKQSQKKMREDD